MVKGIPVRSLVIGKIHNEFIIDTNGRAYQNILGGSLLYAAGSLGMWIDHVGLVGAVAHNFPLQWENQLKREKFDIRGIYVIPEEFDQRSFFAYTSNGQFFPRGPVAVYAAIGLPLPPGLLDYNEEKDSGSECAISDYSHLKISMMPEEYLDASMAHICPLDLQCQIQITSLLQKGSVRLVTLQPQASTMAPENWDKIPVLVKGLSAVITTERDLRNLFRKRTENIHEMMGVIGQFGCTSVVVKEHRKGYLLYSTLEGGYFQIPDYDGIQKDPTGALDAFCGGFLARYSEKYNPIEATVQGSVAASLKLEGTGPFSIRQSLPGLAEARFEQLMRYVQKI